MAENDVVSRTFRSLMESADRKFARVRDLPAYGRAHTRYFHKVFKAYMRLWKYQQENRSRLVECGLKRWEIGEIASRIGQLYYGQYMRTSEARYLLEAYIFYEAILKRRYFEEAQGKDRDARFKELRFYARFLLVALLVNRPEMVRLLSEKLSALVDDSRAKHRETDFKEWKLVVHEISRFTRYEASLTYVRPLRNCDMLDSHPDSKPYVARFHAKKVLKLQGALLTSYHRNEVKFAELTLDTYRMLQCLEWEPSGSFYQKRSVEPKENGIVIDHSAPSGQIDLNLVADMSDPTLPPNPKKASLYRPSVTHLLAVLATICEELPPESVVLLYLSATGKPGRANISQVESYEGSRQVKPSMNKSSQISKEQSSSEFHANGKRGASGCYGDHLWLGPSRAHGGSNNLYPGDLIPFTRRPLFLIIDSDNSHAFKALHGAERGEPAALLLSPLKPVFKDPSSADMMQNGSQFTFFLTAPVLAFCRMLNLPFSDAKNEICNDAEAILASSFSEWEVVLCTCRSLDLVWAQVLSDPFLRRLILRFIFCRSVLTAFCHSEDSDQYLPLCLPDLPESLSPKAKVVQSCVSRLADHLGVTDCFRLSHT